jgi:nucleoside-diphosphate-sugar epimerase
LTKILLVGGAGYVGSVLAESLLAKGFSIRVIDSLVYGNSLSPLTLRNEKNYDFHYGDMADREALERAMEDVTDVVILAGLVGDPICNLYPSESERTNYGALNQAMEVVASHALNSALFISTCSNYGLIPESDRASESYPLAPLSSYAEAKVAAEHNFLHLMQSSLVEKPVVLRFATAFGLSTRMRFDLTVNQFTRDLFLGINIEVFDPDTWRHYCHVLDFARLVEKVLEADPKAVAFEVFNVGGDKNNHTKREIVEIISEHHLPGRAEFISGGGDARNYRVDFAKVRSILDFEPEYSVGSGVEEIILALEKNLFPKSVRGMNQLGNYELEQRVANAQR